MKKYVGYITACLLLAAAVACQPAAETPMAGSVLSGELEGAKFKMATGDEYDKFIAMNEAFNNMDAAGVFANAADSVSMHAEDGSVSVLTEEMFEAYFGMMDSVKWDLYAVIPLQVEGSEATSLLVFGREIRHMKDGTVWDKGLFERFVYRDGKMTAVYQWTKEPEES